MNDETELETKGVSLPELDLDTEESPQLPSTGNEMPNAEGGMGSFDGGFSTKDEKTATDLEAVFDVPVTISAILGKTDMEVSALLRLTRGAIIELDRKVGEAIDIYVNDRLVARGEVVLVEDQLGVTMTEIIQSD